MPKEKKKKEWNRCFNKNIDFGFDEGNPFTALNQGSTCCNDKHQTFYGAIIKSPQWNAWYKEQMKRFRKGKIKNGRFVGKPVFDIDECIGIGAIGDEHLQEFFKFIKGSN